MPYFHYQNDISGGEEEEGEYPEGEDDGIQVIDQQEDREDTEREEAEVDSESEEILELSQFNLEEQNRSV